MKLYSASASPFVRKVRVAALELGIDERIERIDVHTTPVSADPAIAAANPLKKIPTLVLDDGKLLYDSGVICAYLDSLTSDVSLIPEGAVGWQVKRQEALADGLCDAAILVRYEMALRPEERHWRDWIDAQLGKVASAVDQLEAEADDLSGAVTLGSIAAGCALEYLDFRFADLGWRDKHPKIAAWQAEFAKRPTMQATQPA